MYGLTIVIPTKNEEKDLPCLLASLANQREIQAVVIVVDAQSTDQTRGIAHQAGAHVLEGGAVGYGRNAGARAAQTEWILFLDADVLCPSPSFLVDVLTECEDRSLDLATCRIVPNSSRVFDRWAYAVYHAYVTLLEHVLPHAPGFCILVRRSVHERIGGFDEGVVFGEDMEYVQRAARKGFRFGILRRSSILTSVRRFEKDGRFRSIWQYLRAELFMLLHGPIRKPMFLYEMGGSAFRKK